MSKRDIEELCFGALKGAAISILFAYLGAKPVGAVQPQTLTDLAGTWVNTQTSGAVAQVIIAGPDVHPYGFCSPTNCDWGSHSALFFSNGISSSTAIGFQVTIDLTSQTEYLQGHLITGPAGQRLLEITTQTTFPQGDSRNNYEVTEDFQIGPAGV